MLVPQRVLISLRTPPSQPQTSQAGPDLAGGAAPGRCACRPFLRRGLLRL